MNSGNFVTFSYSSTLTSFNLPNSDELSPALSGNMPASLPATANITIGSIDFMSNANGTWCTGVNCAFDYGFPHLWSVPPPTTSVPATQTPAMIGVAVMLALIGGYFLKRSVRRASARV